MVKPPFLLIALALFAASVRADETFRPPYAVSPKIAWRTSVQDAFVEAIEKHRPLVVFFALDPLYPTKGDRHVSNEQRLEFDRPELAALADDAVFVACYYDAATGRMKDEYGERVRSHLNFASLPTTVVIVPRTDVLMEVGRYEGLFNAVDLATGLRTHIDIAMMTDAERERLYAFERATANPRTPEEAIAWYSEAFKNSDPYGVARVFAQPYGIFYKSMADCRAELSAAKLRLNNALRDQFGLGDDLSNLGFDFESMRAGLAAVSSVSVVQIKCREEDRAVVEIQYSEGQNTLVSGDMEVILEDGAWRILPAGWQSQDVIALYDDLSNEAKFLAMQLDLVTDQIRRGEFASREQAILAAQAASEAISKVNNAQQGG